MPHDLKNNEIYCISQLKYIDYNMTVVLITFEPSGEVITEIPVIDEAASVMHSLGKTNLLNSRSPFSSLTANCVICARQNTISG